MNRQPQVDKKEKKKLQPEIYIYFTNIVQGFLNGTVSLLT